VNRLESLVRSMLRIAAAVLILGLLGFGALAFVVRQPSLTSLRNLVGERSDPATLRRHVEVLSNDLQPRADSHRENLAATAAYIERAFRASGARTSLQSFTARGHSYANVVAELGPADSREPVLIVGAHYDAFSMREALPGADDNASGTAALMELARILGRQTVARPVLLVAFANEEPPFFGSDEMGSAIHAQQLAASGRPVQGMISLEMIGYYAPRQAWPNWLFETLYPSTGDFIGVAGSWPDRTLTRTIERAIRGSGSIDAVSFTGPRETSDASDHRNYWAHGWKAVMVTDTAFLRNPNYHTARDTADTLDYVKMAHVTDGVANAILHLVSD
jgi:hypothetical protein